LVCMPQERVVRCGGWPAWGLTIWSWLMMPPRRRARTSARHEDRDRVVEVLRLAAGDGRLTVEELDERVGAALTAYLRRTHGTGIGPAGGAGHSGGPARGAGAEGPGPHRVPP
jgi:hypothetical protein